MSLNDFINEMIRCLSDKMGDSYLIIPKKILKNNSIELDYLVIQKCLENVAPCICVNPMYLEYLNGKSIESMVDHVIKIYENSQRMRESELVSLCNFENAEEKIVFRLINYKRNKKMQ